MKKLGVFIFLLFLFYGHYEYVDMRKFESSTKTIEVKGEVMHPGVYEVAKHATIAEIIKKAGGITDQGDISQINHTLDLSNHSVLVVKEISEEKLISINTATLKELDTLPGIGPVVAQRILDFRANNVFLTLDDLKNIKGIGDKMFEKIKDKITL